jgi:hypothetical protein
MKHRKISEYLSITFRDAQLAVLKHAVTLYQTRFRSSKFTTNLPTILPTRATWVVRSLAHLNARCNAAHPSKRHPFEQLCRVDELSTAVHRCAELSAPASVQSIAVQLSQRKKKRAVKNKKEVFWTMTTQ